MRSNKTLTSLLQELVEKQDAVSKAVEDISAWAAEQQSSTRTPSARPGAKERTSEIFAGAWFRQELLPAVFGITTEAARKYRSNGLWLEGKHWRKDPANRVVYSRQAIEAWMAGEL